MAHFYVKSSFGTCVNTDGAETTARTGAFSAMTASETYPSIAEAINSGPAGAGDTIYVSDVHDYNYSSSTSYSYVGPVQDTGNGQLRIISVDDTDCTTYKKGAAETQSTSGGDLWLDNSLYISGVSFSVNDRITMRNTNMRQIYYECDFDMQTDRINCDADGGKVTFIDCRFSFRTETNQNFLATRQTHLQFIGGQFGDWNGDWGNTPTAIESIFEDSAGTGGLRTQFFGTDLSLVRDYIIQGTGALAADGCIMALVHGCELHASVADSNEAFNRQHQNLILSQSSSSSAAAEYQYSHRTGKATLETSTTRYRTATLAFPDSAQKTSLLITTSSAVTPAHYVFMDLPVAYTRLSDTATDNVRIHFLADNASLKERDVYFMLGYIDGTNNHEMNFAYSHANPWKVLNEGSALSTTTEAWTGTLTGFTKYYADIATSGNAGADGIITLRIIITKASLILNVCPVVVLS